MPVSNAQGISEYTKTIPTEQLAKILPCFVMEVVAGIQRHL